MPILKDTREIKEVKLSKSGVTVKIKDGLIAADVATLEEEGGEAKQGFMILLKLIVSWDATDEANKPLSVSLENLQLLPVEDLQELQNNLTFVQDFLAQATEQDKK